MTNLQKMYPKSPIGGLVFEEWVDMRLEKVEKDKKLLQRKIDAALTKSILKAEGEFVEIKACRPFQNLPLVDWRSEAFIKIRPPHKGPCSTVDFEIKSDVAPLSDLEAHRDHWSWAGIGSSSSSSSSGFKTPLHFDYQYNCVADNGPREHNHTSTTIGCEDVIGLDFTCVDSELGSSWVTEPTDENKDDSGGYFGVSLSLEIFHT